MKILDTYTACAIAEGFDGGDAVTLDEQMEAWSYLIRTGMAWKLQGFYGRTAQELIDLNIINASGVIQ